MRKAQKTVKRQIKINEKKEIKFIEKPTESELNALSLKTLLLSLEIVIGNHQKVWKNEKDGYLNPYYKILIGRCKNLTSDIYNKCYDDVKEQDIEYEDNFYTRQVMTAHVKDCANSIWEKHHCLLKINYKGFQQDLQIQFIPGMDLLKTLS